MGLWCEGSLGVCIIFSTSSAMENELGDNRFNRNHESESLENSGFGVRIHLPVGCMTLAGPRAKASPVPLPALVGIPSCTHVQGAYGAPTIIRVSHAVFCLTRTQHNPTHSEHFSLHAKDCVRNAYYGPERCTLSLAHLVVQPYVTKVSIILVQRAYIFQWVHLRAWTPDLYLRRSPDERMA